MAVQAFLRHADLVAVKCLPRSGVARVLWRVLFQFFFFSQESPHQFSQWLPSSHASSTEDSSLPHPCHHVLSFVFLMLATLPNVG